MASFLSAPPPPNHDQDLEPFHTFAQTADFNLDRAPHDHSRSIRSSAIKPTHGTMDFLNDAPPAATTMSPEVVAALKEMAAIQKEATKNNAALLEMHNKSIDSRNQMDVKMMDIVVKLVSEVKNANAETQKSNETNRQMVQEVQKSNETSRHMSESNLQLVERFASSVVGPVPKKATATKAQKEAAAAAAVVATPKEEAPPAATPKKKEAVASKVAEVVKKVVTLKKADSDISESDEDEDEERKRAEKEKRRKQEKAKAAKRKKSSSSEDESDEEAPKKKKKKKEAEPLPVIGKIANSKAKAEAAARPSLAAPNVRFPSMHELPKSQHKEEPLDTAMSLADSEAEDY